uniref:Uncharacterized protein n=1 Tax=Anopheles albimanus TaxID=7167 RepID=A0A182FZK0_ANOAL
MMYQLFAPSLFLDSFQFFQIYYFNQASSSSFYTLQHFRLKFCLPPYDIINCFLHSDQLTCNVVHKLFRNHC